MLPGPLLSRMRVLAARVEGTPGTAETPLTAADATFNVWNAQIQQAAEMEARQKQGGFGMLPSVVSGRKGKLTFSTHLYGGSAQPAWAATFLPSIGLGWSTTKYLLDPRPPEIAASTQKTVTLALYENGLWKQIFGAMGNAKFTFPASKLAVAEYEYTGKWTAPDDVLILDPIYSVLTPLRVVSATLALGAWTPKVAQLTLDLSNEVYLREDVNDATGYSSACISNRLVKGTIDPEAGLKATHDVYGDWLASTELATFALVCHAGSDDVTITGTKVQLINPQEGDRSGLQTDQIEFQMNADDLQMVFT